jgi:hypothetical protein
MKEKIDSPEKACPQPGKLAANTKTSPQEALLNCEVRVKMTILVAENAKGPHQR